MSLPRPTLDQLRERLVAAFPGAELTVEDESHLHAGHAGASGGAGHYRVRVVSASFSGRSLMARHRLVYDAVQDWMPARIHALTIEARTPDEALGSTTSGSARP